MRRLPDISYGTRIYPEKVARPLRLVNVMAWAGAAFVAIFSVYDFLYPDLLRLGVTNALIALFLGTIPFWHRFGPLVAPLAFGIGSFAAIYVVCSMLGTDSGMQLQYAAIMAG